MNEQKKHLEYFASQPTIGNTFLCDGSKAFKFFFSVLSDVLKNISSGKISTDPEKDPDLEQAIKALLKLLIDGKKSKLSENEFSSLIPVSFSDDMKKTLRRFYTTETSIKDLLNSNEYNFRDLEWRLEAKVIENLDLSLTTLILSLSS